MTTVITKVVSTEDAEEIRLNALECIKWDMSYSMYCGWVEQAYKEEYVNEMTLSSFMYNNLKG